MKGVKNMIGMNLKALRKAKGYSQEEVAEKINVSRQSVAKWENEESIPDVIKCSELANLYEISLDELDTIKYPLKRNRQIRRTENMFSAL